MELPREESPKIRTPLPGAPLASPPPPAEQNGTGRWQDWDERLTQKRRETQRVLSENFSKGGGWGGRLMDNGYSRILSGYLRVAQHRTQAEPVLARLHWPNILCPSQQKNEKVQSGRIAVGCFRIEVRRRRIKARQLLPRYIRD